LSSGLIGTSSSNRNKTAAAAKFARPLFMSAMKSRNGGLLAVVGQNLVAGRRDLGAVLLKAGENDEIALIHYSSAIAGNIFRAGFLFLWSSTSLRTLCQRGSGNGCENKRSHKQGFQHHIPSI
jgi:hypothetical protein